MTNEEYWKSVYDRVGRVVFRYIDRMNDLVPEDDAEKVLGEFLAAVNPIFNEMPAPNPFHDVPSQPRASHPDEVSEEEFDRMAEEARQRIALDPRIPRAPR